MGKSHTKKKDDPEAYTADESLEDSITLKKPNLDGDRFNFYLLTLLYVIQGFPIGLSTAIPIILQSKKTVTYDDQAAFSISVWPYSLKLLWAPVVDALYSKRIGRRKSWLLPLQILMGSSLLCMAYNIDDWMPETGKPNLRMLVIVVFFINLLSATQDIVVDGWALTMLKKNNVSYASTCNSVGVPFGMFIGNVCSILLVSEYFNNIFLRTTPSSGGVVTMKGFLCFCGITVILITILVGIFKKENDNVLQENDHVKISVCQNYKILWNILKLPHIRILALALFTAKIGFCATDNLPNLNLIDAGLPKENIMVITTICYAVKFTMPIFISKYTTGPKPMSYYLKITPFKLLWAIPYVVLIYYTPSLIHENGIVQVSMIYYFTLGFISLVNEMLSFFMILALFAFFCRLSDPKFGGTYMTLFNTFFFLGFLLSNTFILKLVDLLTFKRCSNDPRNLCTTSESIDICNISNKGTCAVNVNGYYIVTAFCMVVGFVWYGIFGNIIKNFQSMKLSHWTVNVKQAKSSGQEVMESIIT
ncbi:Major facilitator superfamily domain,Acetyl-coenzyme A transporter 1 [Cinara cedri]|uniref:Major facilitator superfamily domain,Acetyl-coenzyme A transporter 1 n=1 Tax=Cinara cedri TaxID=506608 RepID=A0A5E4MCV7_9HEMI|nr:Major facilitator superfamily domain,Acetyl-coenzyme A transporter 1 [Cinara cedri]